MSNEQTTPALARELETMIKEYEFEINDAHKKIHLSSTSERDREMERFKSGMCFGFVSRLKRLRQFVL